jgi:hypothetical protein
LSNSYHLGLNLGKIPGFSQPLFGQFHALFQSKSGLITQFAPRFLSAETRLASQIPDRLPRAAFTISNGSFCSRSAFFMLRTIARTRTPSSVASRSANRPPMKPEAPVTNAESPRIFVAPLELILIRTRLDVS